MTSQDSYSAMLARVQQFHDKHQFKDKGGEDLHYRMTLMAEELGEIAACISKGKSKDELAEECADLLILLMGTAIAADFDLNHSFWKKMDKIMLRKSKMIAGKIRVSEFDS
ncbi:MAG: nucleoside triphosphate pyrophosphohydrolase family protein [Gammaproteobacteria bacterium]|nr:nucleoside triphosphate pyrophosphohydrolase family protein [Gammaproteobacteria bacterium]